MRACTLVFLLCVMKPNEKVSDSDVREMRRRFRKGSTYKELAYDFGLSRQQVTRIVKGDSRKDVR